MAIPLTAARGPLEFTPLSLAERKPIVKIMVRVPTLYERDSYASALVRGGVVYYTKKQIRDLMLAGIIAGYPEEEFEDKRALLEELWQVGDEEAAARVKQQERLVELYDVPEGTDLPDEETVKAELDKIVPEVEMDPQRRVRATAIQQHVTSTYEPIQKAFASLTEQEARRAWLQAEIYVCGFTGYEHQPEGNGKGGLKTHEVNYLRGQMGGDAWLELSDFITALHGIDGDEEKNLASLLESMSAPDGSTVQESNPSSESGPSTDAPITPIPDAASPKTTGSSSRSGTSSRTKKGK